MDGGNTLMAQERTPTAMGQHALEQRQLKADLIGEAYALAGIDAMALGAQDWILGKDWILEMVERHELPILAANLNCAGEKPFPGHKVVEVGGRKLGFVGTTFGPVDGCTVDSAAAALNAEVEAMGPVDVVIGLVPAQDVKQLGQAMQGSKGVDVVIDSRGRHSHAMPEKFHGVHAFGAGSRGKSLGLLELQWVDGGSGWMPPIPVEDIERRLVSAQDRKKMAETRAAGETDPDRKQRWERQVTAYESQINQLTAELNKANGAGDGVANVLGGREVQLDRKIEDHEATRKLVDAAKEKMTAVAGTPDKHLPPHRAAPDSPFAGAQNCQGCHPTQYLQWAETNHATSLQSLIDDNRHMDEQCFTCHVTGVGKEGGPKRPIEVRGLRDVQCEACHGAARAHMTNPEDASLRPARTTRTTCTSACHDNEQDEGRFDYEAYLPQVDHSQPAKAATDDHEGRGH